MDLHTVQIYVEDRQMCLPLFEAGVTSLALVAVRVVCTP
jgi:hypothetical protein